MSSLFENVFSLEVPKSLLFIILDYSKPFFSKEIKERESSEYYYSRNFLYKNAKILLWDRDDYSKYSRSVICYLSETNYKKCVKCDEWFIIPKTDTHCASCINL